MTRIRLHMWFSWQDDALLKSHAFGARLLRRATCRSATRSTSDIARYLPPEAEQVAMGPVPPQRPRGTGSTPIRQKTNPLVFLILLQTERLIRLMALNSSSH